MADKVGDIVVPRGPDLPDPALMLSFDRDLNKQLTDYLTALARKANAGDITDGGTIVGDVLLTGDLDQTGNFTLTGDLAGTGTFAWTGDGSFSGSLTVADEAYDATGWDADLSVPTKNAVRDKIELILGTTLPAAYQPLDTELTQIAGLTRNRGDLIRGGASAWEDVALGASGTFLKSDGTDALWVAQPTLVSLEGLSLVAGDILYATNADTLARLAIGAYGQVLRVNSGATALEYTGAGAPDVVLEDQKSAGTSGGTATSGSWETRTLNTEVRDPFSLMSLSSNQFTPTVSGWVEWEAPAHHVAGSQSRLFNVTGSTVVAYGYATESPASNPSAVVLSKGGGPVTGGVTYRIENQVETTRATDGYGRAGNFGGTEVYTRVLFWRT